MLILQTRCALDAASWPPSEVYARPPCLATWSGPTGASARTYSGCRGSPPLVVPRQTRDTPSASSRRAVRAPAPDRALWAPPGGDDQVGHLAGPEDGLEVPRALGVGVSPQGRWAGAPEAVEVDDRGAPGPQAAGEPEGTGGWSDLPPGGPRCSG